MHDIWGPNSLYHSLHRPRTRQLRRTTLAAKRDAGRTKYGVIRMCGPKHVAFSEDEGG